MCLNTLRLRWNKQHFADDIFKRIFIFFNENVWISIKISLKFVPRGSINNIPASVQVMAWRRPGDKPLSEPMMVRLPMHMYASLGLNELTNPLSNHICGLWCCGMQLFIPVWDTCFWHQSPHMSQAEICQWKQLHKCHVQSVKMPLKTVQRRGSFC